MKKEKRKDTEISIYSIPATHTMLYIDTLSFVMLFNPHNSPVRYLLLSVSIDIVSDSQIKKVKCRKVK